MEYALQFNSGFCYLMSFLLFVFLYFISFKKYPIKKNLLICCLWVYITQIFNICFFPISANYKDILLNIEKVSMLGNMYNLKIEIDYLNKYDGLQQILNIIMLIPFGVLIPNIFKKNSLISNIVICIIFPLLIETTQFIITNILHISIHFTDINDVINNIVGGLIGLIINYFANQLYCYYIYNNKRKTENDVS